MSDPDEPNVRTEDLTAYAEGRLPAGSRLRGRVERHLRDHPEDAKRVRQFRRQDTLIREAFNPVAGEQLPDRVLTGMEAPPKRRWHALAGIAAALMIGIGVGWTAARLIPGPGGQAGLAGFVERVGERIARSPNLPVQQSDEIVDAIASRNGPNLSTAGLELIGSTDMPGVEPGVRRFDYRDAVGNVIHLFVAPDIAPASPSIHTRVVDGRLLAYWHLGDSTFVLAGQPARDALIDLARRIRAALDDLPKRVQLSPDGKGQRATIDPAMAHSARSSDTAGIGTRDDPGKGTLIHGHS